MNTGRLASLKQALRARRQSRNVLVRCTIELIAAAHRMSLFVLNRQYRSVALLKLFNPQDVHQTTPDTWMDRYPAVFSACRNYFADRSNLKILSYECSTGEEVLTLRNYFPTAFI